MNLKFLVERARPYTGELVAISGLSVLGSFATLAVPWLAGKLIAGAIGVEDIDLSVTLAMLLITLTGLTGIKIAVAILSDLCSGRILAGLRSETYHRLQAMSVAFHDRSKHGDLLSLMTYEVGNLSSFLISTLANVPSMVLTAFGAVILLFLLDPVMALVVPVLVPLFYVMLRLLGRRLRVIARRVRRAEAEIMTVAASDLAMLPAIKAFTTEEFQRARYNVAIERTRQLALSQARITAFIGPVIALLAAIAAIGILIFGSNQIASGTSDPAKLFSFLLYAALLTRPVESLVGIYGNLQIAKGTLARLEAIFSKKVEPGYAATGRIERAYGDLAFRKVSFGYSGRAPVLKNLDLEIAAGEIIALTGDNGAGKSTLIRLLLRFYDPDAGQITLDGVDIASLQVQNLRQQFGYVPQRPLLFSGTVAQNIAFGIEQPDPAAIERAARGAQAWDFIQHLPGKFETEIGDNGIRLSGGQQQRIALARALFRNPPIFILDEATSMYDLEGEAAFVETCIDALRDRTVIIITHRPASLALADRIIHASPDGFIEQTRQD